MTPLERRRLIAKQQEEQEKTVATYRDKARIKKSIIETFIKKNNHIAIKLMFFIARKHNIQGDNITFHNNDTATISLNKKEVLDYCNIDHRSFKSNIKALMQTSIEVYEQDQSVCSFINILPKVDIINDEIRVTMFLYIIAQIQNVVDQYVTIDTKNLMKLKHKHSLRMIQLLEIISGYTNVAKQTNYSCDELNAMFGTNYKRAIDLERKILLISQQELDENSKISFTYEKKFEDNKKSGRPKCIGFKIILRENMNRQQKLF